MRLKTTANASGEYVRVAPGLAMPAAVTVQAEDVRGYDVDVDVVVSDGRLVAREVRVRQRDDGPPVTGEAIRGVPLAGLVRQAAQHALEYEQSGEGDAVLTRLSPVTWITPETAERLREAGPTTESLRTVATLYRIALLTGQPPTTTVEKSLGLPRSTTGRWVALARERGFLDVAEGPGKAGG